MKPEKITVKIHGKEIIFNNNSCDDYRLQQMMERDTITAGEVFCRLGIPLPAGCSETTPVKVKGEK